MAHSSIAFHESTSFTQASGCSNRRQRVVAHPALFFAAWLLIAFVSVHDGYLTVLHRKELNQLELNPMARTLFEVTAGKVWLLVTAKAIGTVTTCSLLLCLYWRNRRLAIAVAVPVAIFQLLLLLFLIAEWTP